MGLDGDGVPERVQRLLESIAKDEAAARRAAIWLVLDIACGHPPPGCDYAPEEAQLWLTAPGYAWLRLRLADMARRNVATVEAMIAGRRADGWRLPQAPPMPPAP